MTASLVKPAIFGAFDGLVTVLGVLFALAGHPHTLLLAGSGLAAAGCVSMGGGQWLSDSEHGLAASAMIGATTGLGTLVPVAPYVVWRGTAAAVVSVVLCLVLAGVICAVKTTGPDGLSVRRAATQTYGVLVFAAAVTLLCAWLTGAV